MGKRIRLIALLLAVTLTLNIVTLPVNAEGESASTEQSNEDNNGITALTEVTPSEEEVIPDEEEEVIPSEEEVIPDEEEEVIPDEEEVIPDEEEEVIPGEEEEVIPGEEEEVTPGEEETDLNGDVSMLSDVNVCTLEYYGSLESSGNNNRVDEDNFVITIENTRDLILLSNIPFAEYKDYDLKFVYTGADFDTELNEGDTDNVISANNLSFRGLAWDESGTAGSFQKKVIFINGSNAKIRLTQPLFCSLSTDASFVDQENANTSIKLVCGGATGGLLAQTVTAGTNPDVANWNITLFDDSTTENTKVMPALLGTMEEGSGVALTVTNKSGMNVSDSGDLGFLCGTMKENSSLTLKSIEFIDTLLNVTATGGNAGGLVGVMGDGASLTVNQTTALSVDSVTASGNAGGLVGQMDANTTLTINSTALKMGSVSTDSGDAGGLVGKMGANVTLSLQPDTTLSFTSVKGSDTEPFSAGGITGTIENIVISNLPVINGDTVEGYNAGGLIGAYTYSGGENVLSTVSNNISLSKVSGVKNAGGVFGILTNNSGGEFTISSPSVSVTELQVTGVGDNNSPNGDAGGLIGRYDASSLKASLKITAATVSSTLSGNASSYGGLVAWVYDNQPVYLEIGSNTAPVSVEVSGTAKSCGGLIASLSDKGHMVKVGKVTVTKKETFKGTDNAGGLVGRMPSGVLWLSDKVVTDISTDSNATNRGWILGSRGNTLVYNTYSPVGDTWDPNKGGDTNDIGTWGQVVQVHGDLADLVTDKGEEHTVSVCDANGSYPDYTIGVDNPKKDFAAIALRCQLDVQQNGALQFVNSDGIGKNGTISITINADVELDGTGFTGFQRDVHNADSINVTIKSGPENTVRTITFPNITIYSTSGSHNRLGLFSKVSGITATDLTLDGGINYKSLNGSTFAGALVAETTGGDVSLTRVTGSTDVTASGSVNDAKLSGLIAYAAVSNLTDVATKPNITFNRCKWESTITDEGSSNDFIAGFLARTQGSMNIRVENCEISGRITKAEAKINGTSIHAGVGGLIASVIDRYDKDNTAYYYNSTLTINGLTAQGVSITLNSAAEGTVSGGLLGFEWMNTDTTISGVTIKGCTLDTKSAQFGGLVYKGSGEWVVEKTGNTPGICFTKNGENGNTISGRSVDDTPSGLLVGRGDKLEYHQNALYLVIQHGAYIIDKDSTTVTPTGTYFDEIVGTTIGTLGNGVVSIETERDEYNVPKLINQKDVTYHKQLADDWQNPKTRYYYNLDYFRGENGTNIPNGTVSSAPEMVLWGVGQHCYSGLKEKFSGSVSTITGDINLEGYSYYPVSLKGNIEIKEATITLNYSELETAEDGNKKPSDGLRQHANMHTGIFSDVKGKTLTVNGLVLNGNVGFYPNEIDGFGSGALICEVAEGVDNSGNVTNTILKISNVKLNGIRVSGGDARTYAPLLINRIGSHSSLTMRGVTTTSNYLDTKDTSTEADDTPIIAATSLIGHVGDADYGTDIKLSFGDMGLDARDAQKTAPLYSTYRSIFSRATFLESFRYSDPSTCSGEYNFTMGINGADHNLYTVGVEISNTTSGRNQEKQYLDMSDAYVYDTTGAAQPTTDAQAAAYFATGYLRYVKEVEEEDEYHFELDINQRMRDIAEGCGTYADPYIIKDGSQLEAVAAVIKDTKKDGWSIVLNVDSNGKIIQDHEHTSGQEASGTHATYTCDSNGIWSTTAAGLTTKRPSADEVRKHLRNAYYLIENDITIGENGGWAGLGENDGTDTYFSGVIVGKTSGTTVSIIPSQSASQFGGLIKFSQGSVVRNLTVSYSTEVSSAPKIAMNSGNDYVPNTKKNATFCGGVVGWCLGGDTIIDNVTVSFGTNIPTVTEKNSHLAAVGGYVGLVGGALNDNAESNAWYEKYGGGVVFRNMPGNSKLTSATIGGQSVTATDEPAAIAKGKNYFYVNPYVGRVLDGYVLSEDIQLENTDKNYEIPTISAGKTLTRAKVTKDDVDYDTVTVADAEDLWLLSAIANSGAGCKDNNNYAYRYGKARTGTYENVGESAADTDELADEAHQGGVVRDIADSYLTETYTTGDDTNKLYFYNLNGSSGLHIVLESDCNMSGYGNGFRGIGTSYGANANSTSNFRLVPVSSVNGGNHTVTLGQSRKEYTEEKAAWTSIGSGLFVLLKVPTAGFTASELNLAGNTGIAYYKINGSSIAADDNKDITNWNTGTRLSLVGAGMLAGNLANNGTTINSFTLDKVVLAGESDSKRVTVNGDGVGSTHAGGLIGVLYNVGTITNVTVTDCKYNHLTVSGRMNVGGLIGYLKSTNATVQYSADQILTDGKIYSKQYNVSQDYGTGGVIGFSDGVCLSIQPAAGYPTARLKLNGLIVQGNGGAGNENKASIGGIVGYWKTPKIENATCTAVAKNISLEGNIEIAGSQNDVSRVSVGGLAGAIADNLSSWGSSNTRGLLIQDVEIAHTTGSDMKVYNGRPAAGFIGTFKVNSTEKAPVEIINVRMGSADGGKILVSNNCYQTKDQSAAGFIASHDAVCSKQDNSNGKPVLFQDIQMENVTVLATANSDQYRGGGIFFSYSDNDKTDNLKNISLKNCTVIANRNDVGTGVLYSHLAGSVSLAGSNILIENCTVGRSTTNFKTTGSCPTIPTGEIKYDGTKMGIIGGFSNSRMIKLVGVSIQQKDNTLPGSYYGTGTNAPPSSDSYVIRADYTGDGAQGDKNTTGYPFVTTSPSSPLGTLPTDTDPITITGDGAAFVGNTSTHVGQKILSESESDKPNQNLVHSAVPEAVDYLSQNTYFSDFYTAGDNTYAEEESKPDNFPVLVLATNNNEEINQIVYSCISLLTNSKEYKVDNGDLKANPSEYITLSEPVTYKWDKDAGAFVKLGKSTLKQDAMNKKKLELNGKTYDNEKEQFTLLEVTYKDPASTTGDIAYHLYIPVIVRKVFQFKFWAAAKVGTTYIGSEYDNLDQLAIASNGEPVTVLLGYEYLRSKSEWQTAVDDGDDLLWNYNKSVVLSNGGIPAGSELTLVDRTNANKAYTAMSDTACTPVPRSDAIKVDFTKFVDSKNNPWEPVLLCDQLVLTATPVTTNGNFVETNNANEATLRIGTQYYRPIVGEEVGTHKITVGADKISEQYYLTIKTPTETTENWSGVVNTNVTCASRLDKRNNRGLANIRVDMESGRQYTRKGNENKIITGEFFRQTVYIETPSRSLGEMIKPGNSEITVTMTTEISFNEDDGNADLFSTYAGTQRLYQSFELSLNKFLNNNSTRQNIVPGTLITVNYKLDGVPVGETEVHPIDDPEVSYRLNFPESILISDMKDGRTTRLQAEITLDYTDAAILEQFPIRTMTRDGIQMCAASYLSYTPENLANSTIRKEPAEQDGDRFYRTEFKTASLNYYPCDNASRVESVDQLGINGLEGESFQINSIASYNVSALEKAANASKLKCTLTLYRRDGTYENGLSIYTQVPWKQYIAANAKAQYHDSHKILQQGELQSVDQTSTESDLELTWTLDLTGGLDKDAPIQIPVTMQVSTGKTFEENGLTYANYRVRLEVSLLEGSKQIDGSEASDYIVYTNAKILKDVIAQ